MGARRHRPSSVRDPTPNFRTTFRPKGPRNGREAALALARAAGGASASAREEVAKVWPTVEATFQKLSLGIDVLKSKLKRETAAREAAEAKLRGAARAT